MPKRTLHGRELSKLKGKELTVYLDNGKAITGKLLEYDDEALKLTGRDDGSPPSMVDRRKVTTYHAGRPPAAPARKTTRGA